MIDNGFNVIRIWITKFGLSDKRYRGLDRIQSIDRANLDHPKYFWTAWIHMIGHWVEYTHPSLKNFSFLSLSDFTSSFSSEFSHTVSPLHYDEISVTSATMRRGAHNPHPLLRFPLRIPLRLRRRQLPRLQPDHRRRRPHTRSKGGLR